MEQALLAAMEVTGSEQERGRKIENIQKFVRMALPESRHKVVCVCVCVCVCLSVCLSVCV